MKSWDGICLLINELEARLNDNDAIDASGITEGQTEIAVGEKVVQKEDTPVGKVGK